MGPGRFYATPDGAAGTRLSSLGLCAEALVCVPGWTVSVAQWRAAGHSGFMTNPDGHESMVQSGSTTKKLVAKAQKAWDEGDKEAAAFYSQQAHAYAIGSLLQHAPKLGRIIEGSSSDAAKQLKGALRPLSEALKRNG